MCLEDKEKTVSNEVPHWHQFPLGEVIEKMVPGTREKGVHKHKPKTSVMLREALGEGGERDRAASEREEPKE